MWYILANLTINEHTLEELTHSLSTISPVLLIPPLAQSCKHLWLSDPTFSTPLLLREAIQKKELLILEQRKKNSRNYIMRGSIYVWMMKKASTGDTVGTNRREGSFTGNLILNASFGDRWRYKKRWIFGKLSKGGEGYHFNQKIDTAAFGLVNRAVVHVIWRKKL